MILIFGGAYQGKEDFAKEHFGVKTVSDCAASSDCAEVSPGTEATPALPDFSADAACGLEAFARACTEAGAEAKDLMKEQKELWQDKVLIITDVSQGIVPMDKTTRAFREMNGRLMLYLASEAEEVWRVFCGIGKRIK